MSSMPWGGCNLRAEPGSASIGGVSTDHGDGHDHEHDQGAGHDHEHDHGAGHGSAPVAGHGSAPVAGHGSAPGDEPTRKDGPARLEDADLSARMSKDEEAKRLRKAQLRVLHLRLINGGQLAGGKLGAPVCIVFEGWDAAGKGGAIKRLVEPLDPRHVHIAPFGAPTPDELRHHFLWRFWPPLPGWGGMTIFDRSWYGRVLVERVEKLATEVQWRRAYDEINDFEHSLAEEGMVVIKLWLHMSHEEQLRRFERRRDDPLKSWKLTDEDWRNREKRPQYNEAVADMLRLTSGRLTPWDVISSENKRNGRVEVIETVIRRMEEGMARWGIEVPSSDDEEEERTQAALAFDDAEFQADPDVESPNGADSAAAADAADAADQSTTTTAAAAVKSEAAESEAAESEAETAPGA
jgi:polyphosphate kinase 2 (PPK2 family)